MSADDRLDALRELLRIVHAGNAFHAGALRDAGVGPDIADVDAFTRLAPLRTKAELSRDHAERPPFGTNLSFPIDRYTRFSQTSGTTGTPLRWLDTPESWDAMLDLWQRVLVASGIGPGDRLLFAFSFGPFLGFWTAFEAAQRLGCLCLPGGGTSTQARARLLADCDVTALCCTPTYALHLGRAVADLGLADRLRLRRIVLGGEPGGSIGPVRDAIAHAFPGATVHDHHGMTEVGPVTLQDSPGSLRIMDDAFIAEVIDPDTLRPVPPGTPGELVLTTLRRAACPAIRYRTGDLVRQDPGDPARLPGGILGRIDDMVHVRGVNIYPTAVDAIVRRFPDIAEYRATVTRDRDLADLVLDVECAARDTPAILAEALREALGLRITVRHADDGALPRFELKARRWIRLDRHDTHDTNP